MLVTAAAVGEESSTFGAHQKWVTITHEHDKKMDSFHGQFIHLVALRLPGSNPFMSMDNLRNANGRCGERVVVSEPFFIRRAR